VLSLAPKSWVNCATDTVPFSSNWAKICKCLSWVSIDGSFLNFPGVCRPRPYTQSVPRQAKAVKFIPSFSFIPHSERLLFWAIYANAAPLSARF